MAFITRIAPSPTGDMHLGTVRTAYFNYLAAKSSGGKFILRIDDTDISRSSEDHVRTIIDTMKWLRLDYDLIIHQSNRVKLYRELAHSLVSAGYAQEIEGAVRLSSSDLTPNSWADETLVGVIDVTSKDKDVIQNMVLMKSDGMPTYHFASVVDDMDLGVNWIIRGTDHITNTAKQITIWNTLSKIDWYGNKTPTPKWSHVGLLYANKKKLAKRDGAASTLAYKNEGIHPDALLNFVLRLGWGPTVDDQTTKMITRGRAIELFLNGGNMRAAPANIDMNILRAYDRRYKAVDEKIAKSTRN